MSEATNEIRAWHFIRDDGTTGNGNLKVEPGQALRVEAPLVLCERGLHASRRAIDALCFAPGAMVCRVLMRGEMIEGDDKLVAAERQCLWMADATRTLHEFAIWCAEQALALVEKPDPRSLKALEVKRAWLDDNATDDELAAAWAAARDAAWDAARAAARDAAWAVQNEQLERMLLALEPVHD